ncbi:MAG: beta-N-acetylhexosaminidase [Jiangellaceae bacterium]
MAALAGAAVLAACASESAEEREQPIDVHVVPQPVSVVAAGEPFVLDDSTQVSAQGGAAPVAEYLAGLLRASTGLPMTLTSDVATSGAVSLLLDGGADLGSEGYHLDVTRSGVVLRAHEQAGLFRGVQTLRQLLPAGVERDAGPGPWELPGVRVADRPRFAWRGAMLDVARHFFTVDEVKRFIDLVVLYKINIVHLHLTDDQGWRIAVDSWPELTGIGASTEVGGGPGGYYTKAEYTDIVEYAGARFVTVVPEIDVPGHTNAALASYPELNCDGRAPEPFTGTRVGFSALCLDKPVTYEFLEDVLGEVASLTPGPFLHIGGDEARTVSEDEYATFAGRVQKIVASTGKRAVGWQELATGELEPGSVVQYWNIDEGPARVVEAVRRGAQVVLSPADRTYLDMKYDAQTALGYDWAGYVDVRDAYDWDPAALIDGVTEAHVVGVEAALWTETVADIDDAEMMTLPRLPAIAEVAWSPQGRREWEHFRSRLAAQAPRWAAMGADFHRSPHVPWP